MVVVLIWEEKKLIKIQGRRRGLSNKYDLGIQVANKCCKLKKEASGPHQVPSLEEELTVEGGP